jgi:hypothetical protein
MSLLSSLAVVLFGTLNTCFFYPVRLRFSLWLEL